MQTMNFFQWLLAEDDDEGDYEDDDEDTTPGSSCVQVFQCYERRQRHSRCRGRVALATIMSDLSSLDSHAHIPPQFHDLHHKLSSFCLACACHSEEACTSAEDTFTDIRTCMTPQLALAYYILRTAGTASCGVMQVRMSCKCVCLEDTVKHNS